MRLPPSPPLNEKGKNSEFLPATKESREEFMAHPGREGSPAPEGKPRGKETPEGEEEEGKGVYLQIPPCSPSTAASLQVGHSQGHFVPEQGKAALPLPALCRVGNTD